MDFDNKLLRRFVVFLLAVFFLQFLIFGSWTKGSSEWRSEQGSSLSVTSELQALRARLDISEAADSKHRTEVSASALELSKMIQQNAEKCPQCSAQTTNANCPPAPAELVPPPPPSKNFKQSFTSESGGSRTYYISNLIRAAGGLMKKPSISGEAYLASVPPFGGYNAVIDGGAFDATDYTLPAFRAGYSVFTFELSPSNHPLVLNTFRNAGLIEGRDFTVIRPIPGEVPKPPEKKEGGAHIYFFEAGLSNINTGVAVKMHSMLKANEAFEVAGANSPDSVFCASSELRATDASRAQSACAALIRLDDVLPSWARFWVLKLDVQGHEPHALEGAKRTLSERGKVHSLSLEWWPTGIVSQGIPDGGIASLRSLYDLGAICFDVGTVDANKIPGLGVERPSTIEAYTAALLRAPRTQGPGGDPIGAWDDLYCQMEPALGH
jgi:hypothetical protein